MEKKHMQTNISPFTLETEDGEIKAMRLRVNTALLVIEGDGSMTLGLNNAEPVALDLSNISRILRIRDGQTEDGKQVVEAAILRRDNLRNFMRLDSDVTEAVLGNAMETLRRELEILEDADLGTLLTVYTAMANARTFKKVKEDGEDAQQRAEALQAELDTANETITTLREANGELTTRAETAEDELNRIRAGW
ncbi:MAG: hypothetical protein QY314_02610 [Candidatus Dojkabacteria bacterium]|nr:MAG: hypothetical protein QY314_02610 [Candidatus Dojkabacteria bacterium]